MKEYIFFKYSVNFFMNLKTNLFFELVFINFSGVLEYYKCFLSILMSSVIIIRSDTHICKTLEKFTISLSFNIVSQTNIRKQIISTNTVFQIKHHLKFKIYFYKINLFLLFHVLLLKYKHVL